VKDYNYWRGQGGAEQDTLDSLVYQHNYYGDSLQPFEMASLENAIWDKVVEMLDAQGEKRSHNNVFKLLRDYGIANEEAAKRIAKRA
jgi:hypothetical protein